MKKSLNVLKMQPGYSVVNRIFKKKGSDAIGVHPVRRQKVVKLSPAIAAHREEMARLADDPDLRELRPMAAGPAAIFDAAHQPRLHGANYIAGDRRRRAKRMKPVVEQPVKVSHRQEKKRRMAANAAREIMIRADEYQQVAG